MRWTILLAAFALWLGSLVLVYLHCRPAQIDDLDATSRAALTRSFADNAAELRAWNIFVDPAEIETAKKMLPGDTSAVVPQKTARREWNGIDEKNLVLAGRIETRVKNKTLLSLDEETSLRVDIPGTPLQVNYFGTAHVTSENGLDSCKMNLKFKYGPLEIDSLSKGTREGNDLTVTTSIVSGAQTLHTGKHRENIGGNAALNAELAPFQYNPSAKPGHRWTILVYDLELASVGDSRGVKPVEVRCDGRTTIIINGAKVETFEVRSTDGSGARAWYSPDGVVLKQVFKLAGIMEVVLVRDEPEKTHPQK